MFRIYLFAFLVSVVTGLSAQDANVLAKLDTNAMLIGDHVGLTLKYTGPSNSQVMWPFMPDTILGHITVIGRGKIDTAYSTDKKSVTYSQHLNFTCYDSGFYTIPSIPFSYRITPDTTQKEAATAMMLLAVHTVKVDTTQSIKPIIGPLGVPLTFREMLPWILGALAVVAIVGLLAWYFLFRKKSSPVFQLKPRVQVLPHERALQEFEKLRVKKLWQNGKIKEYHSELTEILRRYIEDRFHVPALEQTSAEITGTLKTTADCPQYAIDKLNSLLVLADMVKFAKSQPVASENELSLAEAVDFVRATTAGTEIKAGEGGIN